MPEQPSETKSMTISVPENMDEKTAQDIFLLGMRTMINLYKGSVVVSYGIDKQIHSYAFRDNEAGSIIDFCNCIISVDAMWEDKKHELEKLGGQHLTNKINELIKELFSQKSDSPAVDEENHQDCSCQGSTPCPHKCGQETPPVQSQG